MDVESTLIIVGYAIAVCLALGAVLTLLQGKLVATLVFTFFVAALLVFIGIVMMEAIRAWLAGAATTVTGSLFMLLFIRMIADVGHKRSDWRPPAW